MFSRIPVAHREWTGYCISVESQESRVKLYLNGKFNSEVQFIANAADQLALSIENSQGGNISDVFIGQSLAAGEGWNSFARVSNVQWYDRILTDEQAKLASTVCGDKSSLPKGNLLDWDTAEFTTYAYDTTIYDVSSEDLCPTKDLGIV